jgi:hypothetical protein
MLLAIENESILEYEVGNSDNTVGSYVGIIVVFCNGGGRAF